jgi:hypothetical protein
MTILRKPVLLFLAFLVAAGVGVFLSLNLLAAKRSDEVRQELKNLLGDDVTFASVETGLWDGFGFTVKEFRVADNPLFAATPFVQARELRLGMSFWHLLRGRLVVNSLTFTQPEFQIITNEDGQLNVAALTSRKKELIAFPRLRTGAGERKNSTVSFLITRLKVVDGRIDFIDRSVSSPAELQVKRIDLDLGGLDLAARARIKLAASLAGAPGQDVRIAGEIGPPAPSKDWAQQPVNLEMQFDSLYLPMLARAIPFFRDRIPRELDITGPMHFRANLSGSLQKPRFTDITLKVPFLGSSDYNAVLEGSAELTHRDWGEAPIAGQLTLSAINLAQLRKLPLLRQALAEDFSTNGTINIRSRFAGTWNQLRLGVLLDAEESDMRYPGRMQKLPGQPAQLKAQISAGKGGYVLHSSELRLGDIKVLVSGALTHGPQPRVSVKLGANRSSLRDLEPFVEPLPFDLSGGDVSWDLLVEKDLAAPDTKWQTRGVVNLAQVSLRHKPGGKSVDRLTGSMSFYGRRARANNISFLWGATPVSVALEVAEIAPLRARYALRSDNLVLADLPPLAEYSGFMKSVISRGELSVTDSAPRLQGTLASAGGIFRDIPFTRLQCDIAWSPAGITFKELRLRALGGEIRAGGSLNFVGQTRAISLVPRFDALSLNGILTQWAPQLKDRLDGQLDLRGEFDARGLSDGAPLETLKGTGTALIRRGRIANFNLIAQLFDRGGQADNAPQRLRQNLAAVIERQDTPVQEVKTAFVLEAQRMRTDNLIVSTPEYVITGAGWIGLDGATQWNGLLVFSPNVTRELQREYGAIRYFVDRKGQLAVSFRLDGKLPNIRIRPENRALAQALRWGTWQRGDELTPRGGRGGKTWLPESLDRLLHR